MKKKLLTETQIRRMAAIAGIPALGTISNIVSEKLDIQAEGEHKDEEEKVEETNEEVVVEEEEMDMGAEAEMEEPAAEEVPQDKIESLVDAVLAAIESETGVPAQRVDGEEEAPAEEPEMEMDAEPEMDAEEPEEEMMETLEPTLAERIAQAVQAVIDEDAALEEAHCSTNEEEDEVDEGYDKKMEEDEEEVEENTTTDDTLEEITKAVVARLRSLK